MKITLTFVALVCLSFLVGYGYVSTTQTLAAPVAAAIALPEKTSPLVKMPPQLETIEEVENGIKEEYLFKIKLLETGEGFHGDEVDAESGAVWLGLFKENNEHFLRSEKIKIRRVHDEIVDEDEQSKSGKSVSVAGKNQPLFLLRNADSLKSGAIKTLFQGYTSDDMDKAAELGVNTDEMQATLKKGFVQKYEIGGKEYTLKVKDAINKRQEKILALVLESKGAKQILHTMNEEYTNYLGTLYWVGDLDHDQKPDFYIELYIHDNVSFKNLYLSSEANGSDLIKKVAYFSTTGC
jgi:hypothetical protein